MIQCIIGFRRELGNS